MSPARVLLSASLRRTLVLPALYWAFCNSLFLFKYYDLNKIEKGTA
jgi:hypothetical protein